VESQSPKDITKLQELAYELRVRQAMTRDVITVTPDTTMAELREVLRDHRISGAPVVEGNRLVGVISTEDLIGTLAAGEPEARVGDKMSTDVVTLGPHEPLVHAVARFSSASVGRFPVLDESGRLIGILTKGDIARAMLKRLELDYRAGEIERYRASHIFEDIVADNLALVLGYEVAGTDLRNAGTAASSLKQALIRLGLHPAIVRRVAVATYEAEMNMVIFAGGGEIVAEVRPDRIKIEAVDEGPGIPDIELAKRPGYSTAPPWVQEMGFGAGMGLPNIEACADEMRLDSTVGVGTHLTVVIYPGGRNE
jgi:CBS domain-containing protein/anti-sigma regulatory factor (Ser/Thr protein kinase)